MGQPAQNLKTWMVPVHTWGLQHAQEAGDWLRGGQGVPDALMLQTVDVPPVRMSVAALYCLAGGL